MLKYLQQAWEECKEENRKLVSDPEEFWLFVVSVALLIYFLSGMSGCALSTEASMPREQELRPVGLVTDPNAYSEMPQGALSEANNIVLRRKGLVEPRPGQALSVDITSVSDTVRRLIPYDGDVLAVTSDAIDNRAAPYWLSDENPVQDEAGAGGQELLFDPLHVSGVKARGNLYLNTADGVRKLTAAQDRVASLSSLRQPPLVWPTAGSGSAIAIGDTVAYRATISATDDNDVVVTSPPSARGLLDNSSGGSAAGGSVTVYLPEGASEGQYVRLYRSKGSTGTPDDELALVKEVELESTDITNGYVVINEDVADADRGAFLYTSPSQEGIQASNSRPHAAKDLTVFRDSVFFLNTTGPHRISVKWDEGGYSLAGSSSGIGRRSVTGDLTADLNVIQSVSDVSGIKIGMVLGQASADFNGTGPVVVEAVSGSDVTVSETANKTSAGHSLTFHDTIVIVSDSGTSRYPVDDVINLNRSIVNGDTAKRISESSEIWGYAAGKVVWDVDTGQTVFQDDQAFVIEELVRNGSGFEVLATHGDEYFPPLPEPTDTVNAVPSDSDRRPSGFQWSKRDQPEHVPEANFALAGDDPILKAVPTKDAMFIFTEGGIWRLTGVGEESGWRIDPFDLSHKLLTPACAVVMQGDIYAWTNHGVVRVTDMGVSESVSAPISNLLSQIERDLATYSTDTGGAWMAANDKDNEILLGVPAAKGDDTAEKVYVLNTKTGAWTTWGGAYNHAVLDPSDGLLRFAKMDGSTLEVYKERGQTLLNTVGSEDDYDAKAADAAFEPIVSSVSSDNVVTLSSANGWTPEVGDLIHKDFFDPAIVISVASGTEFTVDSDAAQDYGTGAVDAYKHFDASVKYRSIDGGDPSTRKHYREAIVQWEELRGVHEWTMGWTSELSDTEVTQDVEYTRTRHATGPQPKRLFVPRDHGRVSRLRPKVTVSQAGGQWQFAGLSFRFEPMSSRVRGSL